MWWLFALACTPSPTPKPAADAANCAGTGSPSIDVEGAVAGTREATVEYPLPWTGEARSITTHVWYPTADTTGEAAMWLGIFEDPGSLVNASFDPVNPTCRSPLVVYSHGSQAWAGNGAPILRQLVAAGWIAAGPDHTDNLLTQNEDPHPASFPLTRTLDVRATIDWIEALPEDDPLYQRVDTSRVLVMGHSYGGQTSWLMSGPTFDPDAIAARCDAHPDGCSAEEQAAYAERAVDPRVVAVAPLDGSAGEDLVADAGWGTMDRPVLYMTGSASDDAAFQRASEGDVIWADLAGACHESFTATELGCDGMEKTRGLEIVSTYVANFAVHTVLGSEDPEVLAVLDGSTTVDPSVSLRRTTAAE